MEALGQLVHPMVRDLAWSVFSDDLILADAIDPQADSLRPCALSELTPARLAWLRALDRSPQPLMDHVGSRNQQRLGLYFESLWHFFLRADPRAELLAHNLPVREKGRTVGEFDCLYRCRDSGETVPLELAGKFYLYIGAGSGGSEDERADWLGPGQRDRLDRKLSHLAGHQTRLATDPAARRLLQDRGLMPDRTEVAVRGRLFRRPDQPCRPPPGFNPLCSLQHWHYSDSLAGPDGNDNTSGGHVILSRQHWLAPLGPGTHGPGTLFAGEVSPGPVYERMADLEQTLHARFNSGDGPQLIASLDSTQRERWRFFVAPKTWPTRHLPGRRR